MITTSEKWKQYTINNNIFHIRGTLTDRDGRTLSLSDTDFMMGTVKILDATSDKSTFGVGNVITNAFNGTLNNIEERFENFNFDQAKLEVEFGAFFEDETDEWIQRGEYTVEKPRSFGNTIAIVGYDYMDKLNRYYMGVDKNGSEIVFPISAENFVKTLCDYCGVPYDENMWQLGAFSVPEFAYNESTTCRQAIGWVLQCCGGYARMSNTGKIVCKWYDTKFWTDYGGYDGGTLSPWNEADVLDGGTMWVAVPTYNGGEFIEGDVVWEFNRVTRTNVDIEEIQITGVRAYVYGTVDEFQFETVGDGGYILALQNNPLINADNALEVATLVYSQVKDLKFHIFEAAVWGSPDMEAGDGCIVQDYKGRKYVSIITGMDYTLNGLMEISLGAETPGENSMETANPTTYTIAGAVTAAYDYILTKKLKADVIEGGILKSKDANENFYLNMTTGELRMNATSLSIQAVDLDEYVEEIASSTADEVSSDLLANFISSRYDTDLANLQDQIDKNITTWFYGYEPTLGNYPATSWTTVEAKNEHIGDLFYDTTTGYCYRFMYYGGVFSWEQLSDSDIAEALSVANEALGTAEGKTTIWYGSTSDTFTGVQNGDYLVDSNGATYKRENGAWTKVTDYNAAISSYDDTWTQTKTFNRLTNNGALQGLYMSGGDMYVNATYIKSGVLTGGSSGQTGYYYLGVNATRASYPINDTARYNLRFIIGTNFAVGNDGTIYATNAEIKGNIVADSLTLGSSVTISSGKVTGLASVATSGSYSDLSGKPNLTAYIAKDGTIGSTPASGTTGFVVSSTGLLQASNAIIYGKLYSSEGTIGGFTLASNKFYNGSIGSTNSLYLGTANMSATIAGTSGSAWRLTVGSDFGVTNSGALYASGANISGALTSTNGLLVKNGSTTLAQFSYVNGETAPGTSKTDKGLRIKAMGRNAEFYQYAESQTINGSTTTENIIGIRTIGTSDKIRLRNYATTAANQYSGVDITSSSASLHSYGYGSGTASFEVTSGAQVYIKSSGGEVRFFNNNSGDNVFRPGDNYKSSIAFGTGTYRWKSVHADGFYGSNGNAITSDRNKKTDIQDIGQKYEEFFDRLKPKTFKHTDGDRIHIGAISQDVEDTLNDIGLTALDFGGFCKDVQLEDDTDPVYINGELQYDYYLRYSEFVMLNTWQIQKLKARVAELEKMIKGECA